MKLTDSQLHDFAVELRARGAGNSHDHIYAVLHNEACGEIETLVSYDDLDDDQQETLLTAYKDGFWTEKATDEPTVPVNILITVEGGLIQSIDNIPPGATVEVRDWDTEGGDRSEYNETYDDPENPNDFACVSRWGSRWGN